MKKQITFFALTVLITSLSFGQITTNPITGNVGIGTTNAREKLSVYDSNFGIASFLGGKVSGNYQYSQIYIGQQLAGGFGANIGYMTHQTDQTASGFYITNYGDLEGSTGIFIRKGGYVGIGTKNPDQKLTVKGKIHTEEIIVDLKVPADYVFQKYYTGKSTLKSDYTMPTLTEIESYTKQNHHLPNVPSAAAIQENGLQLGEMSNVLLQKVEELTLYAIEQKKEIGELALYATEQKKEIEELKAQLKALMSKNK